ncbi:TVP38/TMEM64 family protein [Niveibacterium sp.]|uniref:TVP38/TMEM64 family protein n=1 Tax=Niveibacterium sp. TaxID=2017444 RepID=UPI0035B04157
MHDDANDAQRAQLRHRRRGFFLAIAAIVALALAWQLTPLREMLDLERLVASLRRLGQQLGPIAAVGSFALACVIAVPLSILMLVCALAFGPALGILYGICGATLGSALSFLFGRWLGQEAISRLAGPKVRYISQRLGHRGVLSSIALRLVPVAPFALVNMVAGVSTIRLRDFLFGSAIGMLPLVLVSALFAEQIVNAATRPGWLTLLFVGITLALVVGGSAVLRRWWREAED